LQNNTRLQSKNGLSANSSLNVRTFACAITIICSPPQLVSSFWGFKSNVASFATFVFLKRRSYAFRDGE